MTDSMTQQARKLHKKYFFLPQVLYPLMLILDTQSRKSRFPPCQQNIKLEIYKNQGGKIFHPG